MTFREISKPEFTALSPAMFSILAENMQKLHPDESVTADDLANWTKWHEKRFGESIFIVFESSDALAGYLQYSLASGCLFVEEIEIAPEYQRRFGVLGGLFGYMRGKIPNDIVRIAAYINKSNHISRRAAERLGMCASGENSTGTSLLYEGDISDAFGFCKPRHGE